MSEHDARASDHAGTACDSDAKLHRASPEKSLSFAQLGVVRDDSTRRRHRSTTDRICELRSDIGKKHGADVVAG